MEHPVHPAPCSQTTLGPPGFAMSEFSFESSDAEKPRTAAEAAQYFKNSLLLIFIVLSQF
jgi:hypothetical protein